MRIVTYYSHLNGLEFLQVHQASLWAEIDQVIQGVNAAACRTQISREVRTMGHMLYSPIAMNSAMEAAFRALEWNERRPSYRAASDTRPIPKATDMAAAQQTMKTEAAGQVPILSYNPADLLKNRVAVEVQFGKYAFVAYDLFVKHMAFYVGDVTDVGIEILPMKELRAQMSSGVAYYEGELYNLIREGRGVPAVPLVIMGVAP